MELPEENKQRLQEVIPETIRNAITALLSQGMDFQITGTITMSFDGGESFTVDVNELVSALRDRSTNTETNGASAGAQGSGATGDNFKREL